MNLILSTLFAVIFTLVYGFLAFASFGAGHGIFIYFAPIYPWIFLFAAIILLGKSGSPLIRKIFVALMAIHYVGSFIFLIIVLSWGLEPGMSEMWSVSPVLVFLPGIIYFLGQTIIWIVFFRLPISKQNVGKTNNSLP